MAAKKPKVGDAVLLHGGMHEITSLPKRAVMRDGEAVAVDMVAFESFTGGLNNTGFRGKGNAPDLIWSDADGAWYMMGRLLANDERLVYEALMGVRPPPETHMMARSFLDSIEYADVPRERLAVVVKKWKVPRLRDEKGEWAETEAAWDKRAGEYADACLAHCTEVKEARHG